MSERVFNFRTGEQQRAAISGAASSLKISRSALIRKAVDSYLTAIEDHKLLAAVD